MEVTGFETLGARLARLRKSRALRQKDLADRIGATVQRVSRYENDRYTPRIETLAQLADLLDVSVDFLLTGRSSSAAEATEDHRLRERLPALERLPQPYRDGLVLFLDALLASYYQSERASPAGKPEGAP